MSAQRMRLAHCGTGLRLLDAGCGTGASTAALLSVAPQAEIVAVDASSGMLAEAAAKRWPATVRFVHSRIEDIADAGVDGPFDGILAAYLLRNLDDPDAQLRAFRTLLRPGATLAVHEYSVRDSRLATAMWNAVCATIIIPMGRLRSGDADLYRYLRRSVNDFDGADAFRNRLRANGFTVGTQRDGAGLATQHRAHVPRGGAAMTDPRRASHPAPPGLPDAGALANTPHVVVVGCGHRRSGRGDRAGRTRRDRRRRRAGVLPRRPGRRLDRQVRRRRRPADEPRLPRVLPAVLQPAGPAAAHRRRAGNADSGRGLPAGRRRRAGATRSAACRRRRR